MKKLPADIVEKAKELDVYGHEIENGVVLDL